MGQSRIAFPGRAIELDASALNSLNVIVEYLKVDPTINRIILDGYSDNSGNRLTNRELSRRRALAVMDFFKAQGFDESQISLRFHGEQYPLVPNTSAVNRAKNRRVTVRLERAGAPDKSVPQTAVSNPARIS